MNCEYTVTEAVYIILFNIQTHYNLRLLSSTYDHIVNPCVMDVIGQTSLVHVFRDFQLFYNPTHGNCYIFNSGWNASASSLRKSYKAGRRFGTYCIITVPEMPSAPVRFRFR